MMPATSPTPLKSRWVGAGLKWSQGAPCFLAVSEELMLLLLLMMVLVGLE